VKTEEPDDELSIFAGHTRFVSGQIQRGGSFVPFPAPPPPPPPPHQQQQQKHPHYRSHPHSHPQQQQQQQFTQGIYTHPQHAAAYQAHNAELAQLGLASRLDERWSTFMEDSGLLEDIDFCAR
jgi:hypothetical protein